MNGHRRRSRVLRDNHKAAEAMPRLMSLINQGCGMCTTETDQHSLPCSCPCHAPGTLDMPLPKRPVQNSRCESVPAPDDRVPLSGEMLERMQFFLAASKLANSPEFLGLVAMSLCAYVDTETWQQAVCDAMETLEAKA